MILGGGFVGAKETFGKGKKGGSGTREDGTKRAGSIANVVRGIVFGEVDDVLEDELGLMGVVEEEFATKVEDLHADGGIFIGKGLGELAKDVGCNLGDLGRVFSDTPDDGGSCARHLDLVQKFCEILDDPFVLSCAHLQQLFDGHHTLCNHEICFRFRFRFQFVILAVAVVVVDRGEKEGKRRGTNQRDWKGGT